MLPPRCLGAMPASGVPPRLQPSFCWVLPAKRPPARGRHTVRPSAWGAASCRGAPGRAAQPARRLQCAAGLPKAGEATKAPPLAPVSPSRTAQVEKIPLFISAGFLGACLIVFVSMYISGTLEAASA